MPEVQANVKLAHVQMYQIDNLQENRVCKKVGK